MTAPERLEGSVERVTFFNEETGFAVLRLKVRGHRELVTCLGTLPTVTAGEAIRAEGAWVRDTQHGLQFKAEKLQASAPGSRDGIEKYLGSGLVKGIGPVLAGKLVARFGQRVFDIIEGESARLQEVDKIGPERRRAIKAAWNEGKRVREIMVFLHTHGASGSRAVRIFKTYGDRAIEFLRENPYRLARDIRGIGFKTADAIAQRLGFAPNATVRLAAALRHVLHQATSEGHCALPRQPLLIRGAELLETEPAVLENVLDAELVEGGLAHDEVDSRGPDGTGDGLIYLPHLLAAERAVADKILTLAAAPSVYPTIDFERALAWYEKKSGRTLSDSQRTALRAALGARVFVLTGGPGVGKTTLLDALLKIADARHLRCVLCAPTGRAAQRLSEATGLEARTIHRLLGPHGLGQLEAPGDDGSQSTGREARRTLSGDLVVVDECSMVDLPLMHALLRALPPAAGLLLVGDADQLPSVGPGSVFRDLLESGAVPTARLTEIFRQAAQSGIVTNAHRINRGELPAVTRDERTPSQKEEEAPPAGDFFFIEREEPEAIAATVAELVGRRIPRRWSLDPTRDIQVLCPTHRGPCGTRALNVLLQEALNPPQPSADPPGVEKFGWTFRVRDKVVQTANNYDKEVFNGDTGCIERIDFPAAELHVRFGQRPVTYAFGELDELSPAYAMTIHKSQGSEFPAVVIPLAVGQFLLLQRNLLYTGVTRARRLVVLVGQPRALEIAVRRQPDRLRYGGLLARLRAGQRQI